MATIVHWMEAQTANLGSIQAAYDEFYGAGAFAYLKWNAEDWDEESIEEIESLYACWGYVHNEVLELNFL